MSGSGLLRVSVPSDLAERPGCYAYRAIGKGHCNGAWPAVWLTDQELPHNDALLL
jgi:hypothetical protein